MLRPVRAVTCSGVTTHLFGKWTNDWGTVIDPAVIFAKVPKTEDPIHSMSVEFDNGRVLHFPIAVSGLPYRVLPNGHDIAFGPMQLEYEGEEIDWWWKAVDRKEPL